MSASLSDYSDRTQPIALINEQSLQCLRVLERLAQSPDDHQSFDGVRASLVDSLGQFKVWIGTYGLLDGVKRSILVEGGEDASELAALLV